MFLPVLWAYAEIDSQEPKESNDARFIALPCVVFELSACENSSQFPAESGQLQSQRPNSI